MTVLVGHIEFLNCYPLYYGLQERDLEDPHRAPAFQLVPGVPTALNRMLIEGLIDFGPISSIAYARDHQRLVLSRRLSISSLGAVDSIQLVSRVPLEAVQSIALTPKSATSVALLKTLFKLKYGHEVRFGELRGTLADALGDYDAALVIGDEGLVALHFPPSGCACHDLGTIWQDWTGLPMVYAVWAAREGFARDRKAELREVEDELVASLEYARTHRDALVESAAERYSFSTATLHRYFAILRYDFSEEFQRGLARFYESAAEAGELTEAPKLRFLDEL